MRPPFSLRRRVAVVVIGLAVLLIGTGVGALVGQDLSEQASERVAVQWTPALLAVERLQRAYLDEETGLRGYLLTGRAEFLEPYRDADQLIGAQEAVLRPALAADQQASTQLQAVVAAHDAWSAAAERRLARPPPAPAAGPVDLDGPDTGRHLFDEVRGRVDTLRSTIEGQTAAEAATVARVRSAVAWGLGAAVGLGVLVTVVAVTGIRRSVTRPLTDLIESVQAVADGDLDRPVRVSGPPEFVTVAASVDRMRRMLNEYRTSAVAAAEREAELREAERMAGELREGVIRRLFAISTALMAAANRNPRAAESLLARVRDVDAAIADVRAAALGPPADQSGRTELAGRVADALDGAVDLLGVHPVLRVPSRVQEAGVSARSVDELVGGLRDTLADLFAVDDVESLDVEVVRTADEVGLRVDVVAPASRRTWTVADRAEQVGGRCTVAVSDDQHTVLGWDIPARL